jgi:tetratricopeptide (TPR) repeat protein
MSETARVLRFPGKPKAFVLTSEEVSTAARSFVEGDESESTVSTQALVDPDVLTAIVSLLRSTGDGAPARCHARAAQLYSVILGSKSLGFFDERDYFLGEAALLAGSTARLLGRRDDAEIWLERAEAAFRHTVNPAPVLASVAYARLALHYDAGRYDRALELLPSLITSFQKLEMDSERLKAKFLKAMCFKESRRLTEAEADFEALTSDPALSSMDALYGLSLVNFGDVHAQAGNGGRSMELYQQALPLLEKSNQRFGVAHLKGLIGETLRGAGKLGGAVDSFRGAIADYVELGMLTWVAYLRVVLAETLIALGRNREAEWEILAALPTIEEQKMVPEGFAAVSLLRESVKQRKADSGALKVLREHLQANK